MEYGASENRLPPLVALGFFPPPLCRPVSDSSPPVHPDEIPDGGSLGLLAYGYRGLEAWRAKRGTDWLDAHPPPEASGDAPGADDQRSPLDGLDIVVVSGLPRSGTSMLMQMVTATGRPAFTDENREADESNPKGYFEHDGVKRLAYDKSWVPDADGHVVKVVAPLLPFLPPGPRYRVVFIERSLDEILRSQEAMLKRSGQAAAADASLRAAYSRQLLRAHGWMEAHADMLLLEHPEVIADPLAAAASLLSFLEASGDATDIAATVDPTLYRQRLRSDA